MGGSSLERSQPRTNVVLGRVVAAILDLIVVFVLGFVVGVVAVLVVLPADRVSEGAVQAVLVLSMSGVSFGYSAGLEWLLDGQTLGKKLVGIRVLSQHTHTPPSAGQAILRNIPAFVVFGWLPALVAMATIAATPRDQRVFDQIARTIVARA
ncbi:MAG: RDD family protein [Halococcoides sp.]